MGPADSDPLSRVGSYSGSRPAVGATRTGLSPCLAGDSAPFRSPLRSFRRSYYPRGSPPGFGLVRVRSPLLTESRFLSLPGGTEMFQFPPLARAPRDQRPLGGSPGTLAARRALPPPGATDIPPTPLSAWPRRPGRTTRPTRAGKEPPARPRPTRAEDARERGRRHTHTPTQNQNPDQETRTAIETRTRTGPDTRPAARTPGETPPRTGRRGRTPAPHSTHPT